MKRLFLLPCLFCACFVNGQSVDQQPRMKINEMLFLSGWDYRKSDLTLMDFQRLTPDSELIFKDLDGFSHWGWYNYTATNFSILLGITTKKRLPMNMIYRTGIDYSNVASDMLSYSKSTYSPYDTLISSKDGSHYYLDSVHSQYYHYDLGYEKLGVSFSMMGSTNPKLRWSFYGGAMIGLGWIFNSKVTNRYRAESNIFHSNKSTYGHSVEGSSYFNNNVIYQEEHFRIQNGYYTSFDFPFGIDFRVGKKQEFLQKIHFVYQLVPGIQLNRIAVLDLRVQTTIRQQFGLRLDLSRENN